MPTTNLYFNNYSFTGEQRLIEDLIIEAIKVYGVECYYLPRTFVNEDEVWGEDASSKFESAYPLEMYIKNVDSFDGEGDFLSKFGLEIRDSVTLTISQRRFGEELHYEETTGDAGRPVEGDLIWFPLNGKIFEVKHVEHEAIFYQLGSLQTYDLRCELFEYSSEIIDTGVRDIDEIGEAYSIDELIFQILFETFTDTAFATSTIADGKVDTVTITHPGENFSEPPTVTFESPQGEPQRANTVATVSEGRVTGVDVVDGGGYYTNIPEITFAAPLDNSKSAEGLVVLARNSVRSVAVTDGGFYYHEPPTVSFEQPNSRFVLGGELSNTEGIMGQNALYYSEPFHFFTINNFIEQDEVTLDFFYKPESNNMSGTLFTTEYCRFSLSNGVIEFNGTKGSSDLSSDQWHYIFLNCNTSVYTIWVDGTQELQIPKNDNLANSYIIFGDQIGNTSVGYYDALRFRNNQIMNIATPTVVATNAEATSSIDQGKVISVSVTESGGYYTEIPAVTIAEPMGYFSNSTANATISDYSVNSIQVSNGGFYYTESPIVEISDPSVYSQDNPRFGNTCLVMKNVTDSLVFKNLPQRETGTINFWVQIDQNLSTNGAIISSDDWSFVYKTVTREDPEANGDVTFIEYGMEYSNGASLASSNTWTEVNQDFFFYDFVAIQVRESFGSKVLTVRVNNTSNTITESFDGLPNDFALNSNTLTVGSKGLNDATANTQIDGLIISDYVLEDFQAIPNDIPPLGAYAPWNSANVLYANNFETITTATANASISNGEVVSITIIDGGYGYQSPPEITISSPNTNNYYTATATANVVNGHVVSVSVSNNGLGYFEEPEISFTPAIFNEFESRTTYHSNNVIFAEDFEYKLPVANSSINSNGIVTSVEIIEEGFGYQIPPQVFFSVPDTDQYYRAEANTTIANGQVISVTVTNTGFGYTQSNVFPVVALPIYNTAEASANINANGIVTSITITDRGQGYTSAPKVFITGDPITGALQAEDSKFLLQEESNTSGSSSEDGFAINDVLQSEVEVVDTETNIGFIDFSEKNPFSEGGEW